MKVITQDSIFLKGLSKGPNAITVFNISQGSQKTSMKYVDISDASGKTVEVEYSYQENDEIFFDTIFMQIPIALSELEVKDFILLEIENKLNSL